MHRWQRMDSTGKRWGIAAVLILATLGIAWWAGLFRPAPAKKAPAGVQVDAAAVQTSDVPVYLEGLGTVQALYTDTITARVDGQLNTVAFTEGQMVAKGDLLAQIDPRPYQAALDAALANQAKDSATLASARRDLDRYVQLAPEDLASKQTVDDQRGLVGSLTAQVKSDIAAAENARTQLDYTRITSPIPGRTGIRLVDPGNIVHAADTTGIVVVTQVQPISCIFTLPEDVLPRVTAAMAAGPVAVTAISRDGKTEFDHGVVALIDNQIDQSTGTIRVKARFPNTHNTLWPGEFVMIRMLVQTDHNALTIPSSAVERGPDGAFTYVVKADSTAELRPITLGDERNGITLVTSGLKVGDTVVTSNQYRVQPGSRLAVAKSAAAVAAAPKSP
ncbi:MAG: efflux RND transporter periplasmic adaptor subunit [Steroidobacteraceae bacterium]|jgi:membrane fusion protein, multidrug efflux system